MLSIIVDGQSLYIAKATSLQLEVNSSIFSTDKIDGDIVFTFDVPADINDVVFRHARYVYVQRFRKYECRVLAGGIEIACGELYIQKATRQTYSCGLVVNPFPTDFASQKLSNNDYGGNLIISTSVLEHNQKWLEFLQSTLATDSVVKFPLFIDEDFYGSGNSDFGWFLLPDDTPDSSHASGFQASLPTNDTLGLDRCYINRLFCDANGQVIEANPTSRGIRVFNNRTADNPNSFAFCPALKLSWLLEKVARNGGYNAIGGFFSNELTLAVYAQSMRAMDGQLTQFNDKEAGVTVLVTPQVTFADDPGRITQIVCFTNEQGERQYTFTPTVSATHHFNVTVRTYLPANILTTGTEQVEEYGVTVNKPYVEAMCFMMLACSNTLTACIAVNLYGDWNNMQPMFDHWQQPTYLKLYKPDQLSEFGYAGAGFYELTFDYSAQMVAGRSYRFLLAKCRGHNAPSQGTDGQVIIKNFENIPITEDVSSFYNVYNCFANKLDYAQHVPSMTNSEFISTICNTFGLAFFVDSSTKTVEFSFIRDILANAQVLDLSEFVIDKETAIEKEDARKYVFTLEGLSVADVDETKLLSSVRTAGELPDAMLNYGKSCFVRNENRYRTAEREGDALLNWVFRWNTKEGASRTLQAGSGDEQSVKPSVKIPPMKVTDPATDNPEFIMEIGMSGCSSVFDTGNTDFDLILETYAGRRQLDCPQMGNTYFEVAQPTNIDRHGATQPLLSLDTDGENSIGTEFVRPWLDFLANYEKVTYRFLLPLNQFLQLWQLLKPQNRTAQRQVRWLMVHNVRSLPVKITFQFTQGRETVVAEVESAKAKVEL